ncbi:hypothetical protein ACVRZD_02800 [Streptococcus hongkongensis]|nr:hypothetical protein NC01_05160 [Streptococcus uberis]
MKAQELFEEVKELIANKDLSDATDFINENKVRMGICPTLFFVPFFLSMIHHILNIILIYSCLKYIKNEDISDVFISKSMALHYYLIISCVLA